MLGISFVLLCSTFKYIQFAVTTDEGYYFKYATYIAKNGIMGFPGLFSDYIQNNGHWLFPSPIRIGYIIISSIWLKIFGQTFFNLACLSLFSFYVFLIFCFYFIKKYFDQRIASLSVVLMAFSPLNMAMARRALMDATVNLFTVASVWFFLESLKEKRLSKTIIFIAIYTATILIKENSVLISVFFVFYILMRRLIFKNNLRLIDFLAVTIIPFALAGVVYVALAGGFTPVADTVKIILSSPHFNRYAILFGSGSWVRYIIDFMLLSPWTCILAIGFTVYYLIRPEWDEPTFYLILFSLTMVILMDFFTKNIRYLLMLDMPIRLLAVLALGKLTGRIFKNSATFVVGIFIAAIALFDCLNFIDFFIQQGIYDPVSCWLLKASHIIP